MIQITPEHVQRLIQIESEIHYNEAPPPGEKPFAVVHRDSPVLLSAPHGARTYRNNSKETWHEEDEYTAGIALLLSELCQTSVIATTWRTDDSDPNYYEEAQSLYKRELRCLVQNSDIRWVIDLHGASSSSLKLHQLVDLGTRKKKQSLPVEQLQELAFLIEKRLGQDTVSYNRFAAKSPGTITAYSQDELLGRESDPGAGSERAPGRRVPRQERGPAGRRAGRRTHHLQPHLRQRRAGHRPPRRRGRQDGWP